MFFLWFVWKLIEEEYYDYKGKMKDWEIKSGI